MLYMTVSVLMDLFHVFHCDTEPLSHWGAEATHTTVHNINIANG